jgi:hypothetical protein
MFCLLLFEGTFTSFFKDKSQKESQNNRNQGFSYYFWLMIEESGSGSVPLTNGSGSGRPKNMWIRWIRIRIRIRNTDENEVFLIKKDPYWKLSLVGFPEEERQWWSKKSSIVYSRKIQLFSLMIAETFSPRNFNNVNKCHIGKNTEVSSRTK